MVSARSLGAVVAGWIATSFGCQTPTSMTVEVSTDAECGGSDFEAAVGRPGEVDPAAPSSTRPCEGRGAEGSLVVLPAGDEGAEIAVRVALGVGVATSSCVEEGAPGCIIARRRLRFLEGEAMVLEVPLDEACIGVACDPDQTCSRGVCVSAAIDSSTCEGGRCRVENLGGGSGTGTSSSASGSTGASTSASSTGQSTSSGGGDGGAGGSGGEGPGGAGGGGSGGGPSCDTLEASRMAAATELSCVVGRDEVSSPLSCRGGAVSPSGWTATELVNDQTYPGSCVEHVEASDAFVCARIRGGAGCASAGIYCSFEAGSLASLRRIPVQDAVTVAVSSEGWCIHDRGGGTVSCSAGIGSAPTLGTIAPLLGADGGEDTMCAWGAGGIRCWGGTPSLLDPPEPPGCVADLEVGARMACWAVGATVRCWGDLPPSVLPTTTIPRGEVVDLAVGETHVCVTTTADELLCWGESLTGALGNVGLDSTEVPLPPTWPVTPSAVLGVAAGAHHTIAIAVVDGEPRAFGWGLNESAQISDAFAVDQYPQPFDMSFPEPL